MKVVAYYRSSTDLQENSIDMQRQSVMKRMIQEAIPIDEEFVDQGVSARKIKMDKRTALKRLITAIDNDEVTKLIVYKRDRLARKSDEYMKLYQLFQKKNLDVIFTADNEPPINYSPIGEFFELIMAGIIQREAEQIVERIQQTIKAKFEEGINFGSGIPYGYKKEKGEIVSVKDETDIVKVIYDQALSDKHNNLVEIRQYLKDKNILRRGKNWTVPSIRKVLTEPTYMGVRVQTIGGEKVESAKYDYLSIISKETWIETQKVLDKIDQQSENAKLKNVNFPLLNILICYQCNQPLVGYKARKFEDLKYHCKEHKGVFLSKKEIETKLLKLCHNFFQKLLTSHMNSFFEAYLKEYSKEVTKHLNAIEGEIQANNNKLIKKTEKWFHEKNSDQKVKYEQSIFKLYEKIASKKQQKDIFSQELYDLKNLPEKIKAQKKQFSSLSSLEKMEDNNLSELFHDIIANVLVSEHAIHVQFKHPYLEAKEDILHETS